MFIVKNLTQVYGTHKVVDDVTFSASKGTIMGLIGTNGAGKTTIIKSACGLLKPTKGEITLFGMNIKNDRKEYIRSLGAVLEGNRNIYMRLSPEENIEYYARMRNISKAEYLPRMNHLLEIFQLKDKRKLECNSLSRGMQQKLAICCSIIHDPKIIFLDEPTLGLDFGAVKKMEEIIKKLISKNKIVIVTSHDLNFVTDIVDHVVVINKGKKVLDSSINTLEPLKNKNYFEIKVRNDATIFEDSRIVEVNHSKESKLVRFVFDSPYEISNIIDRFKDYSIPIISINQRDYSLTDLYMDLVKDNYKHKERVE